MKRVAFFSLLILAVVGLTFSGCSSQSTASTTNEPLVFPDQGNIRINGYGYFHFERVGSISEEIDFQGVVFSPHREQPGVTSTGPIAYKVDVQFADGTIEVLQSVGLGNEKNIDINLTKHENPKAGIMMAWHNVNSGLTRVLYLLVSE